VYLTQAHTDVSWYQPSPALSLDLVARTGVGPESEIIDVGGGDSTLVDALLDRGNRCLTVLDISGAALERARTRLGLRAEAVRWIKADITRADLPTDRFDLWHDRAVFHFLTEDVDRQRYADALRRSLRTGGHLILATFASDGPRRCSGLEVMRYGQHELHAALGSDFQLMASSRMIHRTPAGVEQPFLYCWFRKG
jgi:SAM-dependent methyltransferase